jgi:hypothetical protein
MEADHPHTAKPTDVAEVCDEMYLKESKSYRERNSEVKIRRCK